MGNTGEYIYKGKNKFTPKSSYIYIYIEITSFCRCQQIYIFSDIPMTAMTTIENAHHHSVKVLPYKEDSHAFFPFRDLPFMANILTFFPYFFFLLSPSPSSTRSTSDTPCARKRRECRLHYLSWRSPSVGDASGPF